jgi:hypothetical protein
VSLELAPELARFAEMSAPEGAELAALVRGSLEELVSDLSLPASLELSIAASAQAPAVPMALWLRVHGHRCLTPAVAGPGAHPTARDLARIAATAARDARTCWVTPLLADHVWRTWFGATSQAVRMAPSREDLRAMLLDAVAHGFRITRVREALDNLALRGEPPAVDAVFDEMTSGPEAHGLMWSVGGEAAPGVTAVFAAVTVELRRRLFDELGVILPPVRGGLDPGLEAGEVRAHLNDVRWPRMLPVMPGAGDKEAVEVWSRVLERTLRRHAGLFVTGATLRYGLSWLRDTSPGLVESVQSRFSMTRLTRILGGLVADGVAIKDLKSVLEALLSVNATTSADASRRIVFAPDTGNPCSVRTPRNLRDLTTDDYVTSLRTGLKQYLSFKYPPLAGHAGSLLAYLLDPELEREIGDGDEEHSTDQFHDRLLKAVFEETTFPDFKPGRSPVILTTTDVRTRLQRLLAPVLPRIVVVAYQELSAYVNIQPLARIALS